MVRLSTQTAMARLRLSGCATGSDHLDIDPGGVRLDDSIAGAALIGMRVRAARGGDARKPNARRAAAGCGGGA